MYIFKHVVYFGLTFHIYRYLLRMSRTESYKELMTEYYQFVRPPLIPLDEAPEDNVFNYIERMSAVVHPGDELEVKILYSSLEGVMKDGSMVESDEDIVTRLVRLFKECQQVSGVSEVALRSDHFECAKKILRILGRTLWDFIIAYHYSHQIVSRYKSELSDRDNKYRVVTTKAEIMRNIFLSECNYLKREGMETTCYSVFASFLESLELGEWDRGTFRTNVLDVNEYVGSTSEIIIIDTPTAALIPWSKPW